MADEDILAETRAAGLTVATSATRVADALTGTNQHTRHTTQQAQQRYEAQAQVAERLYQRAAEPDWMRAADPAARVCHAAQPWPTSTRIAVLAMPTRWRGRIGRRTGGDPEWNPRRDSGAAPRPHVDASDTAAGRQQRDHDRTPAGSPTMPARQYHR